jgi:hypothetical protein
MGGLKGGPEKPLAMLNSSNQEGKKKYFGGIEERRSTRFVEVKTTEA